MGIAGYGSHLDNYPQPYLSFACAIGVTKEEIDTFAQRLDKTLSEVTKKALQQSAKEATASDQSEPPPPPSADDEQEADEAQPPVQENPPGV